MRGLLNEFGEGFKKVLETQAGDFIYIKPGVSPEVFNLSPIAFWLESCFWTRMLRRCHALTIFVLAVLVPVRPTGAAELTYTVSTTAPGPASPGGSLQTQLVVPTFDLAKGGLFGITFSASPAFSGKAGAFLASDTDYLVTIQMNTTLRLFGPGSNILSASAFGRADVMTDRSFFVVTTPIASEAGALASVTTGASFNLAPFASDAGSQVLLTVAIDPANFSFPSIGGAPFPPTGYGSLLTFGGTYSVTYHFTPTGANLLTIRAAGELAPPGTAFEVAWPATIENATLECSSELGTNALWETVTGSVNTTSLERIYYEASSIVAPRRFYRLRHDASRPAPGGRKFR